MDPNQDPNQQQPNQQFTPGSSVPPDPQKQDPPQQQQPQQPQNEQSGGQDASPQEQTPDYLKGADGPPAPGQATHPPGGYQAQTGESVQAGVGGGAVVQNAPGGEQPAQTPQPGQPVKPPSQPQSANAPQQQPAPGVQPQPQQPDVNSVLQDEQSRLSRLFGTLNKKVLLIIVAVVLLPLIAAAIYLAVSGDGSTDPDQQIRNDLEVLSSGLDNYAVDNDSYPTLAPSEVAELSANYLPDDFIDPRTGETYVLSTSNPQTNDIQYVLGAACGEENKLVVTNDPEQFALRVNLSEALYCTDNQ